MTAVKICGLTTPETVDACVTAGAAYVGFVFYPPSPRSITPEIAQALVRRLPTGVRSVGLVVTPSDDDLRDIVATVPLDLIQLHGDETPARVREIRDSISMPVMKAVRIADSDDVDAAMAYVDACDMLLFDARAPANIAALPGGNGLTFDWSLIAGRQWPLPWLLSGGLTPETVAQAITATDAPGVDVSSGVEDRPGIKSIEKIENFIKSAAGAGPARRRATPPSHKAPPPNGHR